MFVPVAQLLSYFFGRGRKSCTARQHIFLFTTFTTMSPPPSNGKDSGTARVLGSGASGIAELLIFHPVDTVAKRLMSNKDKVCPKCGTGQIDS